MDSFSNIKAGFWIRLSAIIIDTTIIYYVTTFLVLIAQSLNIYVPFELSFIIIALFYSIISLAIFNSSPGKLLCKISVLQKEHKSIGWHKAFIREFFGKFTIVMLLPVGILIFLLRKSNSGLGLVLLPLILIMFLLIIFFIHFLVKKHTWYDYIAGTSVFQNEAYKKRNPFFILLSFLIFATFIVNKIYPFINTLEISKCYSSYASSPPDQKEYTLKTLVEIKNADTNSTEPFTNWINKYGLSPLDYILKKVAQYQVTIFGEMHGLSNYLVMLKNIIPELYSKAGVRVIAMEFCMREDNELLNRLVTSKEYDGILALEISRHHPWLAWGGKEYWDILKAVWELNRNLKPNQEKMKIVGLDTQWDGPSVALTRGTEDGRSGPLNEKLRILRAIFSSPLFLYRDELMANEIETEIINKSKRGIVWIGAAHSFLNYKQRFQTKGRMAYILHKKYGNKIFQIYLHTNDISNSIASLIEKSIGRSKYHQIGFDLYKSPFSILRDSSSDYFKNQPNTCIGSICYGYIFLDPSDSLHSVRYIPSFVSNKMFIKEKPYFELIVGRPLSSATEVNEYYKNHFNK